MKRKVIKHGNSTLTVSMPYKWTKEFDIKKGDGVCEGGETGSSCSIDCAVCGNNIASGSCNDGTPGESLTFYASSSPGTCDYIKWLCLE